MHWYFGVVVFFLLINVPVVDTSTTFEPEEDELLPEWLSDNMTFDTSCIIRGKGLGHGNFGDVFAGKIMLGNAM